MTLASPGSAATAAVSGSPYGISASASGGSFDANNYSIGCSGHLTVSKAVLTITADDKTRAWQTPNPPLTTLCTGLVNNETFAGAQIQGSPGLATLATQDSPVGSYPITVSVDQMRAPNYGFTAVNGTLTVTRAADQTISLPALPVKTYGDPDFDPGGTSSSGLPVGYASSDPTVATVAGGQIRITGAGSTSITASQVGDANHNPCSATATLTVAKALLTVTADDQARAFGAANPPLTARYAGYLNGENFASASVQGTPVLSTLAGLASPAGPYTISAVVGSLAAPNYSFIAANGTLTVTRADQTVSLPALPLKSYGDPDFPPGGTSSSGLPVGYASSDPTVATLVGGQIRITGAGSSTITASQGGDANHNPCSTTATLTVAKALLTVTADDQARAFGAANPPLTARYAGYVIGESFASAAVQGAPVLSTAAGPASPVGPYTIFAMVGSLAAPNYSFISANGTLTVTKADQTVSLPAPPAKSYGDPDFPSGGTSSSGLPVSYASSDPTVAIVVGGQIQITGAGSTFITATQGGDANHNPSSTTVTLTVPKALLTVTAEDRARSFGTPNPPLTALYTGFVRGETIANAKIQGIPGLVTSATQDSPVGSYPITVSVDQLSAPNYSFLAVNGTLNVARSCQEIIFPPIGDRTYGDPPFVIQASACSGLGISFGLADPSQGVATISGNILTITGAGCLVVTASQQGSGDLDQAPQVSQTVVVHKKGQAISFPEPAPKVQGDPPFTLNATASSALPVSYQSSDPGVAQINGSSVTITGAGTTVITAWQPGNANYNPALPSSQPFSVAEEQVPPVLTLSTLSSGAVTANPVLNIMGSASDATQIASLSVNGADLTGRAALFSSAVLLAAGKNSIEVSARDGAGNLATQTLSVTLDAAAAEISLSAPADNSASNSPACAIRGTVTPGSSLTLSVNGSAAQTLTVTGGAFTGSASLDPGVNTIEFCAALSGRVSRVKRSVTLAPGQPSLAITEPAEDLRTEQASLTLRGTAGGGGATVALDVSGAGFAPLILGGVFQQTLALDHVGEFRITASVTDAAGNTSVAQRNIIRVERILGDLNGDGCVDLQDALAALRISLGMDPASAQALAHGDVAPLVNGVPHPDGVIDAGDVLVILRKIVGLVDF